MLFIKIKIIAQLDICITRIPKNTKRTDRDDSSCLRLPYFSYFLLAFLSILVSKPTVSSIIYRMLLAVERNISGRNCSPVIIQGDKAWKVDKKGGIFDIFNNISFFLNFSLNIYLCITNYNNTPHTIHGSVQLSCL